MSATEMVSMVHQMFWALPAEWKLPASGLALCSAIVVTGVFAYVNRATRKPYFDLWTVSWMFYVLWLASSWEMRETAAVPFLMMAQRASIGISAVFMFWGSFELSGMPMSRRRELYWATIVILAWSYVASYQAADWFWVSVPMFVLLAIASMYTSHLHGLRRKHDHGAGLLADGFLLWGVHLCVYPFRSELPPAVLTLNYIVSAGLALFIAFGMLVQVLELTRRQNQELVEEFKKGIAARRHMEEELAVAEQKYQTLFNSASDAIFLLDPETLHVVESNEAAMKFLGPQTGGAVPRSFVELCPAAAHRGEDPVANKRLLEDVISPSAEVLILRPNGTYVPCEGSVHFVQYNKRGVLQVNLHEITERKELEQQLKQSEKLSALGQLVAGVAHELNNPLAVIMGYAQLIGKQENCQPKFRSDLQKIIHESERAAKVVRNLLTFARPRDPQRTTIDLNSLVAEVVGDHQGEASANGAQVTCRLAPNLPLTIADPNQIEQALTNLLTNALQAVSGRPAPREVEICTEIKDRKVRITVSDTGPGIAPEIIGRIFDPFFTTRSPGKGTGLGLSICYSIVEEHRGKIWVQSDPGKGAKFHIELPVVVRTVEDSVPLATQPVAPLPRDPNAAARHVLVVDDEPGMVEVLVTLLGERGYNIDSAPDGEAALARIAAQRYDLIISDLMMPGLGGEGLYKAVRESDPDLANRIVFVTGDTVSAQSRSFLEWSGNRWFSKPFNLAELEALVLTYLGSESHATV